MPEIREHVSNALYINPSLLTRSLAQIDTLVVKPLEETKSDSTTDVTDVMDIPHK